MALDVTLENSSAKKGKYEYDGKGTKNIPDTVKIEKDKLLTLWLEENGRKDAKLLISTENLNKFEIDIKKSSTHEWQLILTKDPSLNSASQRNHKETANYHGRGEDPGNGQGVTVTIGEP